LLSNYAQYEAMFAVAVFAPALIAELSFSLWLTVKGVNLGVQQATTESATPRRLVMEPELVAHEGMTILGIDVTTSNAAESDPARARLPELWARFIRDNVLQRIPGQLSPIHPVGVYTNYENDQDGRYRVVVGVAVTEGTIRPDDLVSVTVPPGDYLVFSGTGGLPEVVIRTWESVWSYFASAKQYVRAFTADFERYPQPDAIEIYIAVKR
jgi:predicted transcriptional regulator YdeE